MTTVEIRRWDVLDIHYKMKDQDKVDKLISSYVNDGWSKEGYDISTVGDNDSCIQLMRWHKPEIKSINK